MPQFPGMNPYLEGHLFPDLHHALASRIRAQLTPQLRPRHAVRLEVYVVQDTNPGEDLGIVYPDVEVLQVTESSIDRRSQTVPITPVTLTLPPPIPVRIPTIEVRDAQRHQLVTCIEILSYVNKRQPGLSLYLQQRDRLIRAGGHLVEIDLLRRGTRPLSQPQIPDAPYRITVTPGGDRTQVWVVHLQDPLPTIPIPLRPPDADAALDLSQAFQQVCEEADYDLTIDYSQAPPPPLLSQSDAQWLQTQLNPERS